VICAKAKKVIHLTEEAGWAHIASLRKAGHYTKDYEPYPCGKHYHVGHAQSKLRKRIKAALRGRKL